MRLIDADALSDLLVKTYEKAPTEKALLFFDLLLKNNEQVPTVEERPQGKWIFKHNSSDIWCSVCDENFDEIPQKFKFCPNCGADMRGE